MTGDAFSVVLPGRIVFGAGVARDAAKAAAGFGRRVLLVTGANPGRAAWLAEALGREACAVDTVACAGEPTVADAERAVAAARAFGAEVVVAIGGGAALDLGKAAAGLAREAGGPLDHLEVVGAGAPLTADPTPLIAIPTTAGTGAEATMNAVLGAPEQGRKASLRDPRLLPRIAFVDPDLLIGCPRATALASGLDALTQVVEPYVSAFANRFTDGLCREAIPMVAAALPRMLETGDAAARTDMAQCSLYGGIALANAKLGAVHGLAGVIGGRTGAAHGAICGRLLGPILAANAAALAARAPDHPARARLAEVRGWIAAALGGSPDDAPATLAAWADAQGLPRLGALGLARDTFGEIAEASAASSSMKGNPIPLSADALTAALEAAA